MTAAVETFDRARLRQSAQRAAQWTADRDRRIRAAVAAGASLREVGAAVGLSHSAIAKIAKRAEVEQT